MSPTFTPRLPMTQRAAPDLDMVPFQRPAPPAPPATDHFGLATALRPAPPPPIRIPSQRRPQQSAPTQSSDFDSGWTPVGVVPDGPPWLPTEPGVPPVARKHSRAKSRQRRMAHQAQPTLDYIAEHDFTPTRRRQQKQPSFTKPYYTPPLPAGDPSRSIESHPDVPMSVSVCATSGSSVPRSSGEARRGHSKRSSISLPLVYPGEDQRHRTPPTPAAVAAPRPQAPQRVPAARPLAPQPSMRQPPRPGFAAPQPIRRLPAPQAAFIAGRGTTAGPVAVKRGRKRRPPPISGTTSTAAGSSWWCRSTSTTLGS